MGTNQQFLRDNTAPQANKLSRRTRLPYLITDLQKVSFKTQTSHASNTFKYILSSQLSFHLKVLIFPATLKEIHSIEKVFVS